MCSSFYKYLIGAREENYRSADKIKISFPDAEESALKLMMHSQSEKKNIFSGAKKFL